VVLVAVDGTVDLGNGVIGIDTRMSGYDGITAAYLVLHDKPCLIETGTASSARRITEVLADYGVGPYDLASIVVTHVHLDHAGGVGDLARIFPRAQVLAHEKGARHLVDPERLVSSARRVFGDVLDNVFGPLLATPVERVRALSDEDEVDLGSGRILKSFYAPGHASHHVGLLDPETGDLYVGDAAGIVIPETAEQRPATPPPDFDLGLALNSLDAFEDRGPTRLLFSHFGPVSDPGPTLSVARDQLNRWVETTREARALGLDLDHALAMVREKSATDEVRLRAADATYEKFEHLNATRTNVNGIWRWLDKQDSQAAD
jgi:glyoxylase-like metal-dependent hydrolase (beta-lactamase superfamily II)